VQICVFSSLTVSFSLLMNSRIRTKASSALHRHSGLKYVTPNRRHHAQAPRVQAQRIAVYEAARARHPERWSTQIRNWTLTPEVYLNPERDGRQPGYYRQAA
jgi:hypothetical protein